MRVTVLVTESVLEIDGVRYHHHPNGGGLVADGAQVDPSASVDLQCIVQGRATIGARARLTGRITVSAGARVNEGETYDGELIIR